MMVFLEEERIRVRQVREDIRDKVFAMEKEKEISEDEKFKLIDEIDKMTKEYTNQIDEIGKAKEEEILTV
jgi:ribosome recycling factor